MMLAIFLEGALSLVRYGWSVFPLMPRRKIPFSNRAHGVTDGEGGVHLATTDEATIRAWWTRWPEANVGMATGRGIVVLDEDNRPDKGKMGSDSVAELEQQHGKLSPTVTVLSGSRVSVHRYFACDRALPNRTNLGPHGGIDFKADGGYVVAPPSIHPETGRPYQWELTSGPEDLAPAPLPEWVVRLVCDKPTATRIGYAGAGEAPAIVSPRLHALLENDRTVLARFLRKPHAYRDRESDRSPSGVDHSLACLLAHRGYSGREIESAIRASRERAKLPLRPASYYKSTIEKALGGIEK
jgi:hypothetical protein